MGEATINWGVNGVAKIVVVMTSLVLATLFENVIKRYKMLLVEYLQLFRAFFLRFLRWSNKIVH